MMPLGDPRHIDAWNRERLSGSWLPSDGMGANGRFSGGLSVARKSWDVIRADRSLLVLPLLQIVFQLIALAAVLVPLGSAVVDHASRSAILIVIAAATFPMNFISTFFGVAFVFVVRTHLEGRRATLGEAVRFAGSRLGAITGWALVTTAVGVAIQALERVRGGALAARVAGWLVGAAWGTAALFVIPALAADGTGPIAAAKKSVRVVKKKWGEGIVGSIAIEIVSGFWFLLLVIVGAIGWAAFSAAPLIGGILMAIAATGFLALSAAADAVTAVFRFVLFEYAENGAIHAPFVEGDLAYGVKMEGKKRKWSSVDWFGNRKRDQIRSS